MKNAIKVFHLILVLIYGGCAVQTTTIPFGEHRYAPKSKDAHIDILLEEPSRPYELIGFITAKKQATIRFDDLHLCLFVRNVSCNLNSL
jgi:hypothetical protein